MNKRSNIETLSSTSNNYLSSFSTQLASERSAFSPQLASERSAFSPARLLTPVKDVSNRASFTPGQPITPNTYANTNHSTIRKVPREYDDDNNKFGGAFQHHVPFPTPLYHENSNNNNNNNRKNYLRTSIDSNDEEVTISHELNQLNRSGLYNLYIYTIT